MIPMRDGVKLHTEIYTPKNATTPLPISSNALPTESPARTTATAGCSSRYAAMIPDGYIFVFQDIRGRYGSEGKFVMLRPVHDPARSERRRRRHRHLRHHRLARQKCAAQQRPRRPGRHFLRRLSRHHGHDQSASRAQSGVRASLHGRHLSRRRLLPQRRVSPQLRIRILRAAGNLQREFQLLVRSLRPLRLVSPPRPAFERQRKIFPRIEIPTWNDFVAHPNYDDFWKHHAVAYGLKQPTVPNLNVAGWWDQEDFYGPIATYERLEKSTRNNLNYLVAGPWNHGGWGRGTGQVARRDSLRQRHRRLFPPKHRSAVVRILAERQRHAAAEGSDCCSKPAATPGVQFDSWPPREAQTRNLYFHEDGKLSFDAVRKQRTTAEAAFDSYVSDPAHPVPYRHRPVDMTYPEDHPGSWYTWLVRGSALRRSAPRRAHLANRRTHRRRHARRPESPPSFSPPPPAATPTGSLN